ncbi:MAG: cytochrome c oxidase assembly protein [Alphaproteobacteria bacterium]|nr:cytochrome c oxidase assembly protein [Alphaproteobacteria bacterium]NCQ88648.1 cytochrome c oxidase assembly protein [Alphaproteobacteria bacterium]NCT06191.1 cytochrome c oxidase assembly protein [Alphaproteobacteria bacterium]
MMNKNTRVLVSVLGIVFAMGALAFASVPLYDLFCRVTGFGGTTQVSDSLPEKQFDRQITIKFNADTSNQLPWSFEPEKRSVEVNVGGQGLINFIAQNKASAPVTGTAVYNVTPLKAGQYFHKTQCFCFAEQTLKPGESMNMPVAFYIDPAIMEDRGMEDVSTITLSYSFFKAETKELDEALEAFYNAE